MTLLNYLESGPWEILLRKSVFQLGWEKGRVQKKSGTIRRANDQNSGTI